MGNDEIIKQNERINNNLKTQVQNYYKHIIKQCYHIFYSVKKYRKYKSKSKLVVKE